MALRSARMATQPLIGLALCLVFSLPIEAEQHKPLAWQTWQKLGNAELTWGFWDIYTASLYSKTGKQAPPYALVIKYDRNFTAQELLDETKKQWRDLGFSEAQITDWSPLMKDAWPNVKEGDKLIYVYSKGGQFFYQPLNQSVEKYTYISEPALARAFIDIWLSAKTQYPKLRLSLLGLDD